MSLHSKLFGCAGFVGLLIAGTMWYFISASKPATLIRIDPRNLRAGVGDFFRVDAEVHGASSSGFSPQGPPGGPRWSFEPADSGGQFLGGDRSNLAFVAPRKPGTYTLVARFPGLFGDKKRLNLEVVDGGNVTGVATGWVNPRLDAQGAYACEWVVSGYSEGASATVLRDGSVLIAGGRGPGDAPHGRAVRYWPVEGKAREVGPMKQARAGHDALLLRDGKVLLLGEPGCRDPELFDPATNTFELLPPVALGEHSGRLAMLPNGEVLVYPYLARGITPGVPMPAAAPPAFVLDSTGRLSRSVGAIVALRERPSLFPLRDGRVVIVGAPMVPGDFYRDSAPEPSAMTEVFLPDSGGFAPGPAPRYLRRGFVSAQLADGRLVLFGGGPYAWGPPGGAGWQSFNRPEVLDAAGSQFQDLDDQGMGGQTVHAIAPLPDGGFLLAGPGKLSRFTLSATGRTRIQELHGRFIAVQSVVALANGKVLLLSPSSNSTGIFHP